MAQWREAYPDGVEYQKSAINILSPAHLNFCLTMAGKRSRDLTRPFTYADLGSGFSISTAGWAAQFPHAQFHAVDFNRTQAGFAEKLKSESQLDNLHIHCSTFHEFLNNQLPKFDFLIMHGVYSWVPQAVREELHSLIKAMLNPGGVVYIAYNTLPGMTSVEPMRKLVQAGVTGQQMEHVAAVNRGLETLTTLKKAGARFFGNHPLAGVKLESWLQDRMDYLVAELMPTEHRAFYFSDLCSEFSDLGLEWACSADNPQFFELGKYPPEFLNYLCEQEQAKGSVWRETLKDFYNDTVFRHDIFIKEPQSLSPAEKAAALENARFSLEHVHTPLPAVAEHRELRVELQPAVYLPLQAALAATPASVSELAAVLNWTVSETLQRLLVLQALEWVRPALPSDSPDVSARVTRLNLALRGLLAENQTMPVLSAAGGWIKNRDPLFYYHVMALLEGHDVKASLTALLEDDQDSADSVKIPSSNTPGGSNISKQVSGYVTQSGPEMQRFIRRHKLAPLPNSCAPK